MFFKISAIIFALYTFSSISAEVSGNQDGVQFFLWQRNATDEQEVFINSLRRNYFHPQKPVKLFIHGWKNDRTTFFFDPMRDAYLSKKDVNVIYVDWSVHAKGLYIQTVPKCPIVGKVVGNFLIALLDDVKISADNIHIIGWSNGAHIAGFAGQEVLQKRHVAIGRISGLDPSGPGYDKPAPTVSAEMRLSKDDAKFVDVIHAYGAISGFREALGHIDFFPNGGLWRQPGCIIGVCNHKRAPLYFVESITTSKLVGIACESYENFLAGLCDNNDKILMGDETPSTARGNYYLKTNSQSPFGIGEI